MLSTIGDQLTFGCLRIRTKGGGSAVGWLSFDNTLCLRTYHSLGPKIAEAEAIVLEAIMSTNETYCAVGRSYKPASTGPPIIQASKNGIMHNWSHCIWRYSRTSIRHLSACSIAIKQQSKLNTNSPIAKNGYANFSDLQLPYDSTVPYGNDDWLIVFSVLDHCNGSTAVHTPSKTPFKANILQKSFKELIGRTIMRSYFPGCSYIFLHTWIFEYIEEKNIV